MKKNLGKIICLSIYTMIFLFFFYSEKIYSDYYTRHLKDFRFIIDLFPYFLLGTGIFIAAHFNRTKVVFLNSLLIFTYYFLTISNRGYGDSFLISSFITFNIIFIFISGEKGILTVFGLMKITFISVQSYLIYTNMAEYGMRFHVYINNMDFFFTDPVRFKYISLIIVSAVFSASLIFFTGKSEKYVSSSFIISAILISSCFVKIFYYNPGSDFKNFLYSMTFIFHSLIIIASLYFSTWDRVFTDELTGLLNRRALDETLHKLGKTYSITMMDIDHFKTFNDTYGHQAGDDVLRYTADILKDNSFGKLYRYGGEEFSVITTGKTYDEITDKAENFRKTLEKSDFTLKRAKKENQIGKKVNVTVSLGIASSTKFRTNPLEVIQAADQALYRAKKNGRNRIEVEKRDRKR